MALNPVISHFIMPNKRTIIFACKGVLSMAAALFIAMHLELDRPFWAVVASMLLQARPESGLVIEKALYLVAGSVVGGIVAVLILGNFTAYPVIALALLTLWIGLTSYLSAKVQHVNYNYLLGLTGVTAPLIVLLVMSDATTVSSLEAFEVARARLSEAMVGAFCAAMVSVLFIPLRLRNLLGLHTENTLRSLFSLLSTELTSETPRIVRYKKSGALLAAVSQLNHDARASAYDGPEGYGRARACYLVSNESIITASIAQTLGFQMDADRRRLSVSMHRFLHQIRTGFSQLADASTNTKRLQLLQQLHRSVVSFKMAGSLYTAEDMIAFRMVSRLIKLATRIVRVADEVKHHRPVKIKARRLPTYQDSLIASLNAFRSMLIFLCSVTLWTGTGSPPAVLMMMILPPFFSMAFSQAPAPEVVVKKVIYGALLAIPASAFVELSLLSAGSGNFEILIMVMGFPLFVALMAVSWPPTTAYGLGFCLPFVLLTQPGNTMTFSAEVSVTTGLALVTGLGILFAIFAVFKTPDNHFIHSRLMKALTKDLRLLSRVETTENDFVYRVGGKIIRLFSLKSSEAHLAGLQALKNIHLVFSLNNLFSSENEKTKIVFNGWLKNYRELISGIQNINAEKMLEETAKLKLHFNESTDKIPSCHSPTEQAEGQLLLSYATQIIKDHAQFSR